jgi:tetratricopeptide (TPR) repeat protein
VAESPLRVISVLIDKALVARSSSGRLDLHPVVRAFCAGELAKDEAARRTALRMHAAHFAELLERCRARYDGPDEVGAQAELLAELPNIFQAAEQWLADAELIERTSEPLCRLLSGAGRPRDLRAMAERMLASQIRAATAARVLTLCGMAAATMHDPAGARDAFQRALAVADSRALRLHVQVQAVIADLGSDRIAEADEQLRECEAQLRPDDSPLLWIRLRSLQGAVAHARAKPTLALERQTEALRLAQSVQAPLLVATIQSSIGLTLALSGQLDAAEQALRGCLETLKSAGRPEVMRSLNALAFVLMKKGEAAEAASLARQAIDLVERNGGHPAALFSGLIDTLGRALWSLGQRDEARQQFERASSFGGPISEAEARSNLALLDIEVGRHDEAVRSIEKLLQSANEHDLVFARSHALVSGAALAAAKATSKSTAARWLLTVIGQHDLPADEQERASKLLVDLTPVAPEAVAAPSLNEALRELTAYLARLRER